MGYWMDSSTRCQEQKPNTVDYCVQAPIRNCTCLKSRQVGASSGKSPLGQRKLLRVGGEQEVCEIWLFHFHFLSWFPGWSEESPVTPSVRSITALQVSISSRCQEMCVWVCRHTPWAFETKLVTYAINKTVMSLMFPKSDFNSIQKKKKKRRENNSWRQNHLWYMCVDRCWEGNSLPTWLVGH